MGHMGHMGRMGPMGLMKARYQPEKTARQLIFTPFA